MSVVYASLSPPVCQKRSPASSEPPAVSVTFSGCAGRPAAIRAARRSGSLTSRRGLSVRSVLPPTRTASLPARSSSTRSKSAGPESSSRSGEASSRRPSSDMAALSRTYGRGGAMGRDRSSPRCVPPGGVRPRAPSPVGAPPTVRRSARGHRGRPGRCAGGPAVRSWRPVPPTGHPVSGAAGRRRHRSTERRPG